MATGGRVLHHLERRLPEPSTTVLLVGFQAAGTRGWSLQNGAATVRMHGKDVPVRARVVSLPGFSAHGDRDEVARWLDGAAPAAPADLLRPRRAHGPLRPGRADRRPRLGGPRPRPPRDGGARLIPGPRGGRIVLLDGAMGTALLARGLPAARSRRPGSCERPWEVAAVHAAHAAAGAEILLTCTFNLARLDVAGPDLEPVRRWRDGRWRWLAWPARGRSRAASGRPASPAGTGVDRRPRSTASGTSAGLPRARRGRRGPDLDRDASSTAWRPGRRSRRGERPGSRWWSPPSSSRLPGGWPRRDGTPGVEFLEALWRDGAAAVGVNCVAPDAALVRARRRGGRADPRAPGGEAERGTPRGAGRAGARSPAGVAAAVRAGASLAGGCCGAGAEHLADAGRATGRGLQARG